MTLTKEKLAEDLYHAYAQNEPLIWQDADLGTLDPVNAYDVQHAFNKAKGEPVKGYKISLTSKETQDLFHSNSPLYGQIVESKLMHDGAAIYRSEMNEPILELELEFTATEDLSAEDTLEELYAKTELAPGVEVPDSRFKNWFPSLPLALVISDSAVCGRVVVGDSATKPTIDQLSAIHASVTCDGKPVTSGVSSEVLGNPLNALKWLVQRLAQEGKTLSKGTTVSTGTFCMPEKLLPGHYEATFDHQIGTVVFDVIG
ncbi:MAG: 2-keto-4-pentenoate hydratase [Sporolactobacillus sp.]